MEKEKKTKGGKNSTQKCVEAKEQRILTETNCGRVQECLTSCQQTRLQSTLSSLPNTHTHRKHMGKHSSTVMHVNSQRLRGTNSLSTTCTYLRLPYQHRHMSRAFPSHSTGPSLESSGQQWSLFVLNVITVCPFGTLPATAAATLDSHKVSGCGKPRMKIRHL